MHKKSLRLATGLCAAGLLLAGCGFGWWHPAWLLFLTIPLFYWLYHPNSQEEA